MSIPWLRRSWVLVCAHRDPIRVFLILTARLALPPPSLNFNVRLNRARPASDPFHPVQIRPCLPYVPWATPVRLLPPRCPRSVTSVTHSDSVFAPCAPFRGQLSDPFTADHADSADKKLASVRSVPSCKNPSSVRPSPSDSVSALRGLCDKTPIPFLRLVRLFAAKPSASAKPRSG